MLNNLLSGLTSLGTPEAIAFIIGSSIVGMILGVIPGVGGPVLLGIALALMSRVSLVGALALFLGTHAASYFSSSLTAILINTPAHAESFAVGLDGFPMAQRGQAGRALGLSAGATWFGGLVGAVLLVAAVPLMSALPGVFNGPDFVALIALALVLVATLGAQDTGKALASVGLGLLIASIGQDAVSGVFRFTFGVEGLADGIQLVPMALGIFAIPQMVLLFGTGGKVARQDMMGREVANTDPAKLGSEFGRQVGAGIREAFRHPFIVGRAALVGYVCGLIPGIGSFSANFMSYGIASRSRRASGEFGTGIPEGVLAAEGSSIAKEAGGIIPLLALGIPGGVGNALFLAALTIKGITTGPTFITNHPVMPYEIAWLILFAGIVGTFAGVVMAPQLARVTMVPGPLLFPIVISLALVGAFVSSALFFLVGEMFVFGVFGFAVRRLGYSLASFVVALVLAPTLEQNIYLTHSVDPGFSFLRFPLADALGILTILILAGSVVKSSRLARARRLTDIETYTYPLLGMCFTALLAGTSTAVVIYALRNWGFTTAALPVVGAGLVALVAWWRLPREVTVYLAFRAKRASARPGAAAAPLTAGYDPGSGDGMDGGADAVPVVSFATAAVPADGPRQAELVAATVGEGSLVTRLVARGGVRAKATRRATRETAEHKATQKAPSEKSVRDKAWGLRGQYTRESLAFIWIAGVVVSCYLFGFFVTVPLFCVIYSLLGTRLVLKTFLHRAVFGVAAGAVCLGLTYFMFSVLHVQYFPLL